MRSRSPRPHERSRSFLVSEGSAAHHVRFAPKRGQIADVSGCPLLCQKRTFALQQNPAYSITSSASNWIELGTSRPSALAVCRSMTNSNFVDSKTGRSEGFAPPRALPHPRRRFSRVSGTRHKVSVFKVRERREPFGLRLRPSRWLWRLEFSVLALEVEL